MPLTNDGPVGHQSGAQVAAVTGLRVIRGRLANAPHDQTGVFPLFDNDMFRQIIPFPAGPGVRPAAGRHIFQSVPGAAVRKSPVRPRAICQGQSTCSGANKTGHTSRQTSRPSFSTLDRRLWPRVHSSVIVQPKSVLRTTTKCSPGESVRFHPASGQPRPLSATAPR